MSSISGFFDKIIGALSSFNFTSDLFDIIFVAVVIYQLIMLIRGSRTFQLVKGIILLGVVFAIVKLFDMEASEYLFSLLFENALLILVVLFAPELRKILESFGRQSSIKNLSFLNFSNGVNYEKTVKDMINSFCKAAGDMSETKTGALVVFEKEAPLQDIAESGTVVDAIASAELFNGLFFKNSALHDGAVLVRDGRIHSAGCILPLTQNTNLETDLGTRHRAAIGMSEQCDAVVVVVSEETGAISIAEKGELRRAVTTAELREILLDSFIKKTDNENSGNKKLVDKIFNKHGGEKRD